MIGRARTGGAITIVNALFEGVGAAVGIELPVDISVEIAEAPVPLPTVRFDPPESDSALIRATLGRAAEEFQLPDGSELRVRIRSDVPPRVGLKSSSAVAMGAVLALGRALGRRPAPEDAARLAARVARSVGQSATGAFDDAMASGVPGLWVTDNRADEVLLHRPTADLRVVLWIPPGHHPPSPELAPRFAGRGEPGAVPLALADRPWEAMEANSRAVEELLDAPVPFRALARSAGAVAVGISGLGPACAVVAAEGAEPAIASALAPFPGRVIRTRIRQATAGEEGS